MLPPEVATTGGSAPAAGGPPMAAAITTAAKITVASKRCMIPPRTSCCVWLRLNPWQSLHSCAHLSNHVSRGVGFVSRGVRLGVLLGLAGARVSILAENAAGAREQRDRSLCLRSCPYAAWPRQTRWVSARDHTDTTRYPGVGGH